jgi:predicted DNA-binding transcriptional regulator YafY
LTASTGAEPTVRVEAAGCVVVADQAALIDRAAGVPGAGLRVIAETVAVSSKAPGTVRTALRLAGLPLQVETLKAVEGQPALPLRVETAITPPLIRDLLGRGVEEGRQVRLSYFASSQGGAMTQRVVDPWRFSGDLLVGWCHLRVAERTFATDRIGQVELLLTALEHERPEPDQPQP